jgi:hypothetical protein
MLGPILFQKLPYEIRLVWLSDANHEITDLKGMVAMLKKQVETREQCMVPGETVQPSNKVEPKPKPSMVPTAAALVGGVRAPRKCPFCNSDSHNSFNCALDVATRKRAVIRSGRCFNCLAPGHGKDACLSKNRCKTCKGVHHSTLHQDPAGAPARGSGGPHGPSVAAGSISASSSTSHVSGTVGTVAVQCDVSPVSLAAPSMASTEADLSSLITAAAAAGSSHVSTQLVLLRSAVA